MAKGYALAAANTEKQVRRQIMETLYPTGANVIGNASMVDLINVCSHFVKLRLRPAAYSAGLVNASRRVLYCLISRSSPISLVASTS